MKIFVAASILILSIPLSYGQRIKMPQSINSVLIDGRVEGVEWEESYTIQIKDSLWLYFKQDKDNVYICLAASNKVPLLTGVDFFITRNNELVNLHASAKLGERILTNGNYGGWNWWNNHMWSANVIRPDDWQSRSFLRDEAKEFQLRKSLFNSNQFRLMLAIEDPKALTLTYPAKASNLYSENWIEVYW